MNPVQQLGTTSTTQVGDILFVLLSIIGILATVSVIRMLAGPTRRL